MNVFVHCLLWAGFPHLFGCWLGKIRSLIYQKDMDIREFLEGLGSEFKSLLFPVQCPGCGKWDTTLCDECWRFADADPFLDVFDDELGNPLVPVVALGKYGGPLRRVIVAAKHDLAADFHRFLYQCGCRLGEHIADDLNIDSVLVVPAPSSWRRRMRFAEVTGHVAAGVADAFGHMGVQADIWRGFALKIGAGSQGNRGREMRRKGRRNQIRLKRNLPPNVGVILVDDVMTTGATMHEMVQILGKQVIGIAVLARA